MGEAAAVYNPFEPGFTDDPYPHYGELRRADPVHHSFLEVWLLFRYDDVFRLLRDPSLSVEDHKATPTALMEATRQVMGDAADRGRRSMLNLDPPDHTRLRRLVSEAFTPRMVDRLRPRVGELVDRALDGVEAEAEWNGRINLRGMTRLPVRVG